MDQEITDPAVLVDSLLELMKWHREHSDHTQLTENMVRLISEYQAMFDSTLDKFNDESFIGATYYLHDCLKAMREEFYQTVN